MVMLVAEFSTIFLNNMFFLKLLNLREKYATANLVNGLLLIFFFFIIRVAFWGMFMGAYITPTVVNFNY